MVENLTVIKRSGNEVAYDREKIVQAVRNAADDLGRSDSELIGEEVADFVEKKYLLYLDEVDVEEIQDYVEETLIEFSYKKIAKSYIIYRHEMEKERKKAWFDLDVAHTIYNKKYRFKNESFPEFLYRVSNGNSEIFKLLRKKEFCYAGRILANRGVRKYGRKVTYANCYYLPVMDDSLEGIFRTAYEMAKTYSFGGGVGIGISTLRPRGSRVNNAAKETTGSVSFMDLYNIVTGIIGQKNRRGALLVFLDIDHPDIEEFIESKNEIDRFNFANISIKVTDDFMETYKNNGMYDLYYSVKDTGEEIKKQVDSTKLMNKIAYSNWNSAEPGMLFWDRINNWALTTNHPKFEYRGINPCGELPLPEYGACSLSSINLSEIVNNPFTDNARINYKRFEYLVEQGILALDDVLDEGMNYHPLESQRRTAEKYRQIGLGLMGFADLLIKLGIKYGSEESLDICNELGHIMINKALQTSALLAKEDGTFPAYDKEMLTSPFIQLNATRETKELLQKYGLRHSSLLSIAPTGSISNMFGVSGGIEPIFAISYTRKTESIAEEDQEHEIFTPVIRQLMSAMDIKDKDNLPDYVVTAHELDYIERIDIQAEWQKYIDSSISSTINMDNSVTVNDVKKAYVYGHEKGLKGMTIYRDGCNRKGILSKEKDTEQKVEMSELDFIEQDICPGCKTNLRQMGGCVECPSCGYTPCSI